jgi:hypothetical protein
MFMSSFAPSSGAVSAFESTLFEFHVIAWG